ncbi:MAG: hypothetical protein WBQ23_13220 [Bacteroidota bacterium]
MTRIIFSFIALIVFLAPLQAQTYELRYKLQINKDYRFKQVEETSAMAQSSDGRGTQIERKTIRYFTITIEKSGVEGIQYVFVQDTAIVEESGEDASIQQQYIDFQNILTRKPVRVRQSSTGIIESTVALEPLNAETVLGRGATDAMFLQRAALLPSLPAKKLEPLMTWAETQRDTLYPSKDNPQVGRGTGVRFIANSTNYTVGSSEQKEGFSCLKVSWISNASLEEKIIYPSLEEFTEDNTETTGDLYIDLETGIPVNLDVYTTQENTRALFGKQSNVIPSSVRTHTTLELFSH